MKTPMALSAQEADTCPLFSASPFTLLTRALERGGVSYCYWKSARRLPEIFEGRSDLDLLVARSDRPKAMKIFLDCGFKHAPDAPGRDDPVIMSFLGFDESRGVILHAHVHFRLVIGSSLLKGFRLPIETSLLARSRMLSEFNLRVLAPADEALLLFTRAQVEYSALDPIQHRQRRRIETKLRNDFAEIAPRPDLEAVRRHAGEIFSARLADEIVEAIAGDDPTRRRRAIAAKIKRELACWRPSGSVESMARGMARSAMFLFGAFNRRYLRLPRSWGRRAPGGGVVIAFVGVDGSGKSTAMANVRHWLGQEIDIVSTYFGTGDGRPSLLFWPFKALSELAGRLIKTRPKGASHGRISDRPPGKIYSFLFAVWAFATALDKRHKLIVAQRAARRGFVVVTDRYPQNEIQSFNDGPMLHRLELAPDWLKRLEASAYELARRTPPDLVIKLHVGPEVVARREPAMNRSLIDLRVAHLAELQFQGAKVVSIDAQRPLDEVTRIIKREVWALI